MKSKALLVIEGSPGIRLGQALRELWTFRGTILAFAERDFRLKYKQMALGVAWAVIQPITLTAIFCVMLGRFANVQGGGVPYPAFSLSALIAWSYLQSAVSFGANALLTDAALVRKVYFPREVPVFGAIVSAGVELGIGLGLFALVGPLIGARPSPVWLLAPLLGLLLGLIAAAVALAFAGLNVHFRDFRYALPFALQVWLFASPVAYPLTVVPEQWRGLYVAVNPAGGVLDAFRRVLALGELPDPMLLGVSLASTLVILLTAYRLFKTLEPDFADVV
jgi:lipopolysaccharide transport system permease protein